VSERRIAVGLDLGGTKIHTVVADVDGHVLGEDRRPTEAIAGPAAVISRMADSVRDTLAAAGLQPGDVQGAGISSPGPCDPKRGIVTNAPNLPGWHNIHVTKLLADATGMETLLENDANAAAYGEFRYGAGRGKRHIVYVTLGTGIGGGIVIDGKIYEGASGAAGEVGHMVVLPDGPRCNCGSRGCVESLAAGPAIAREAARAAADGKSDRLRELAAGELPTAELVHQAAEEGDEGAREVLRVAGYYLGLGLTGLLNVFNPDALILGGGLINIEAYYLGTAIDTARERAFDQVVGDATITTAQLPRRAGALGASALVLDGRTL
jgi:glucokinase